MPRGREQYTQGHSWTPYPEPRGLSHTHLHTPTSIVCGAVISTRPQRNFGKFTNTTPTREWECPRLRQLWAASTLPQNPTSPSRRLSTPPPFPVTMKHGKEISPWCRKTTNSDSRGTHPIGGGTGKCMGSGTEGKQSSGAIPARQQPAERP